MPHDSECLFLPCQASCLDACSRAREHIRGWLRATAERMGLDLTADTLEALRATPLQCVKVPWAVLGRTAVEHWSSTELAG